jgi:hypothetical protein
MERLIEADFEKRLGIIGEVQHAERLFDAMRRAVRLPEGELGDALEQMRSYRVSCAAVAAPPDRP